MGLTNRQRGVEENGAEIIGVAGQANGVEHKVAEVNPSVAAEAWDDYSSIR